MSKYQLGKHRGRFCVVWYEAGTRKRRTLGTSDKREADREFQRIVAELGRNPKGRTVAPLFEAYIADRKEAGKDYRRMQYALQALQDTFGHLDPASITQAICERYVRKARQGGKSDASTHTELSYLRSALRYAVKKTWISSAPHIWLPSRAEPRDRYLSKDEARALVAACEYPHLKLFVILALTTAGRAGAILDLTWDRVDFKHRQIRLHNPERRATAKGRATVPINAWALAALSEAQEGALTDHVIEWGGHRVGSIKKGFAAAARRAGFDDVSPHVLRHTAAVWMIQDGVPLHKVAQFLGHTDTRTTYKVYARYSPDALQDAAESLTI